MSPDSPCTPFQELLPELALGILDGHQRAQALAHVATCASCTSELEALAAATDAIVAAAPELEPPVGFEVRVLDAMKAGFRDRSRLRRRRRAMVVAFSVALLLGGVGLGALVESPSRPTQVRDACRRRVLRAVHLRRSRARCRARLRREQRLAVRGDQSRDVRRTDRLHGANRERYEHRPRGVLAERWLRHMVGTPAGLLRCASPRGTY